MSFPRYPKYKPSGVEWLGDVPAHWEVVPFKWHVQRNDGGVWGDDPTGIADTVVLRSTEQTVDGHWKIDDPALRQLSPDEALAATLQEGDLLVTKSSGSSLHIGKTTLVNASIAAMRCCYSNFMQRIRTAPSFRPELAWYVLNSDLARRQFDLLSNSTTGLANLNGTLIGQLIVASPPRAEQRAIASFLDRETAKIDALIAEQEKLIELLAEKRQAVISHAVTKGLDPAAPMKPSGVEWLGDVPAHWELRPLGDLSSKIGSGKTPSGGAESYTESGVTFLRSQNVLNGSIDLSDVAFISKEVDASMSGSRVATGDVLLNITGASLGRSARVADDIGPANVNQHVCIIRPIDTSIGEFLSLAMQSSQMMAQIDTAQTGAAREGLNYAQVSRLSVALPPVDEQRLITRAVDTACSTLSSLASNAQNATALLRERRSALISAAVTGQIDVRHTSPELVA